MGHFRKKKLWSVRKLNSSTKDSVDFLRIINCKNLDEANINKGEYRCKFQECTHDQQIDTNNLFELSANLYFILAQKPNLDALQEYLDKKQHREAYDENFDCFFEIWGDEINKHDYDQLGNCWDMEDSSIEFIQKVFNTNRNKTDLLVGLYNLLRVLDYHIGLLKNLIILSKGGKIDTFRGTLFIKKSSINDYAIDRVQLENLDMPEGDVNYNSIKSKVNNFFVSEELGKGWNVEHFKLPNKIDRKIQDISQLKIGYISSSKVKISDYEYEIDTNNPEKYLFSFNGINNSEIYQDINLGLQEVIKYDPHFIILPELLIPLPLQEKIVTAVTERTSNLALCFPGSFHVKEVNKIFNYSKAIIGNGDRNFNIYKNYRYKIAASKSYENKNDFLRHFCTVDGYEHINTSQNKLIIFETSIGRIASLICIDFLQSEIAHIVEERHIDIIFVMALTRNPSTGKFFRQMQVLGEKSGSTIFVCNNPATNDENKCTFVVYIPGFKPYIFIQGNGVIELNSVIEKMIENKKQNI